MTAPAFVVQGRTVTLPVEIRRAASWAAQFLVPAPAAQRLTDEAGLTVAEPLPRRALASIAFVRYEDGDLDAYNEVAIALLVRRRDAPPASAAAKSVEVARGAALAYIRHLPVDKTFTLAAGRQIWGYPKFLADIEIHERDGRARCALSHKGSDILRLSVPARGLGRVPSRFPATYSVRDGVLRRTEWSLRGAVRARPGGARLTLGDHPIADELRSLGLPRRALATTAMPRFSARFGHPEIEGPAPETE